MKSPAVILILIALAVCTVTTASAQSGTSGSQQVRSAARAAVQQPERRIDRNASQYPVPSMIPPGKPSEEPQETEDPGNPFLTIAPNILRQGDIRITTNTELIWLAVFDVQGKELFAFREGFSEEFVITLPPMAAGMYILRAEAPGHRFSEKFMVVK